MSKSKSFEDKLVNILKPTKDKLNTYDSIVNLDQISEYENIQKKAIQYLASYNKKSNLFLAFLEDLEEKSKECIKEYEEIIKNIETRNEENLRVETLKKDKKIKEITEKDIRQKSLLEKTKSTIQNADLSNDGYQMLYDSIDLLTKSLISEVNIDYEKNVANAKALVKNVKSDLASSFNNIKEEYLNDTKERIHKFAIIEQSFFNAHFETCTTNNHNIWEKMDAIETHILPIINIAHSNQKREIFSEEIDFSVEHFLPFAHQNALVIKNDEALDKKSLDIVYLLICRLLACTRPGLVELKLVDCVDFKSFSDFRKLETNVYHRYDTESDVSAMLRGIDQEIRDRYNNVLKHNYGNLAEFNTDKDGGERYKLLVLMNYPQGFSSSSIDLVKKIVRNGPIAGVFTIIMANKEEVDLKNDKGELVNDYGIQRMLQFSKLVDLDDNILESDINTSSYKIKDYFNLDNKDMPVNIFDNVLDYINNKTQDLQEVYHLQDYILDDKKWWTSKTNDYSSMPIGLGNDKSEIEILFKRQDGQNTGYIIGNSGSGKSVVLHNIILNGALKYSPNELQYYLIDFSGNAFNIYSEKKLPHVKVVAKEIEIELAISVLEELQYEALRRAELLRSRENFNGEYEDFRRKFPNEVLPRIVLIVDEFHKLFEWRDYQKKSNDILKMIIKEWGKFGIHCFLATQNLSFYGLDSSGLNEIGLRVVMKTSASSALSALTGDNIGVHNKVAGKGQGVINNNFGKKADSSDHINTLFQGYLINDEPVGNDKEGYMSKIINKLNKKSLKNNISINSVSFDSKLKGNTIRLFDLLKHKKTDKIPLEIPLYLGETFTLTNRDFRMNLSRKSGDNILITGGEVETALNIVFSIILSTLNTHKESQKYSMIYDFIPKSNPQKKEFTKFIEHNTTKNFLEYYDDKFFENEGGAGLIEDLFNEVEKRRTESKNETQDNIFFYLIGFEQSPILDMYNFMEQLQKLEEILLEGPRYGVYTIMHIDRANSFARHLDSSRLKCFNHRIGLQSTEAESRRLFGANQKIDTSKLYDPFKPQSKNRAIYFDGSDYFHKLNPYQIMTDLH